MNNEKLMKIYEDDFGTLNGLVNAYLITRTTAELLTEQCTAIQSKLLKMYEYFPAEDWKEIDTERITTPNKTCLMNDKDSHEYLSIYRVELTKSGFNIQDLPGEAFWSYKSPELVAQHQQIKMQWLIVDHFKAKTGLEKDVFISTKDQKYLVDLYCGVAINHPKYNKDLLIKDFQQSIA